MRRGELRGEGGRGRTDPLPIFLPMRYLPPTLRRGRVRESAAERERSRVLSDARSHGTRGGGVDREEEGEGGRGRGGRTGDPWLVARCLETRERECERGEKRARGRFCVAESRRGEAASATDLAGQSPSACSVRLLRLIPALAAHPLAPTEHAPPPCAPPRRPVRRRSSALRCVLRVHLARAPAGPAPLPSRVRVLPAAIMSHQCARPPPCEGGRGAVPWPGAGECDEAPCEPSGARDRVWRGSGTYREC